MRLQTRRQALLVVSQIILLGRAQLNPVMKIWSGGRRLFCRSRTACSRRTAPGSPDGAFVSAARGERHVAMSTRRRVSFIVICFVTLVAACSGAGNYEHAYFNKHGASYLVEMKGRRRLMAHDPVSAVQRRTYEEALTIELPRIEGVIEGAEIPVRPGYLRYAGRVAITGAKMKVDLYYDNPDENTKVPLTWNGDYILVQRDTPRAP
jgi:hypothetical protein